MGLPVWARWVRSRGATKNEVGELDVPVTVGGQEIRPGDLVVLDADGATVVAAERADEVLRRRARARRRRRSSAASSRRARCPTSSTGCGVVEAMSDIAHLGPVELLTPKGEESLRFFVDVMGMEIEHEDGASTYLRGWGDYQPWSLKLTESRPRAWACSACARGARRRSSAASPPSRRPGLGEGWVDGDRGRGRLPLPRPRRPPLRALLRVRALRPAAPPAPGAQERPGRYTGRGCAVKRLDHVNVLAADVRANRDFCVDALGYRLYERIELDDGSEAGAWMSATIAAHELIYTRDAHGAHGRLHHLAFWVDTREECLRAADIWLDAGIEIEAAPSKHAIAQGFFLYGIEPGGNRIEVTTGGRFVYAPDEPCVVWTEAERAKGQAWGVQTVPSFHTYGTPPVVA